MDNTTYYQKNREELLNSVKDYYQNDKERIREQARTYLKKIKRKRDNMKKIDIVICLKKKSKN